MVILVALNTFVFFVYSLIGVTNTLTCGDVSYSEESSLRGLASSEPPLSTITASSPSECVVRCEETIQCVSIFYDTINNACSLYNLTLQQHSTTSQPGYVCYQTDALRELWVVETVSATSTFHSNHIDDLIGPADSNGWSHDNTLTANEIILRFELPIYIEGITIYEITHPGGINGIKLQTPQNTWYTVWSSDTLEQHSGDRTWIPPIEVTHFKTDIVMVAMGDRPGNVWEEIDAVHIMGRMTRLSVREKSTP